MAQKTRTIVSKILAKLNLTEEGKIGHFFDKAAKALNRNIEALNHNLKTLEFSHTASLNKLDEKIEDATELVESSYTEINVDNIKSNSDQDSFLSVYWNKIEIAESRLEDLKDERENLIESYKNQVEEISEQISEYKRRLTKIS